MPEDRRLAAIMFTDIVGYTRLMGSDEEKAVDMLSRNRSIHQSCIEKFNGTLIKEIGDGILASFSLASEAVRCAVEIQKECKEKGIPLKVGIHEGEMIFSGSDVIGDGVNIASRLQEDAQEGCINISASVYRDIKNKADIKTRLLGEKSFKNVDEPISVYKVLFQDSEKEEHSIKKKAGSKLPYYILSGVVIVIIAFLIIWKSKPTKPDIAIEKTIAVLPFENMSESDEYSYLGDALTDEIIMQLQKVKEFTIRSNTSSMKYKNAIKSIPEIGKELNVNYLIEGAAQRFKNNVRIRVQLIDAISDEHVWGDTYDREWGDIFKLQGDIAKEIASELETILTSSEITRIEKTPTENLEAYELFLIGKENYYRGDESNINSAIDLFNQALEYDPQFALPYIWLGIAYFNQTRMSDLFKDTYADTLKYFANKALSINPYLEEGYWLRSIYYYEKADFDESIKQLEKALSINQNYGDAYLTLALNFKAENNYINAIKNFEKAKKLKIGSIDYAVVLEQLGTAYHDISYYENAEKVYKELVRYDPIKGYFYLYILASHNREWDKFKLYGDKICDIDSGKPCLKFLRSWYAQNKKFLLAKECHEKERELGIDDDAQDVLFSISYGYILYNLDQKEEAKVMFKKQIEYCEESIRLKRFIATGSWGGLAYYYLAAIHAFLGDKEKAYQVLYEMEQTVFSGWYTWRIQVDPMFESLWEDDEFKAIIKRQEMKYADIRAEIDRLEAAGEL